MQYILEHDKDNLGGEQVGPRINYVNTLKVETLKYLKRSNCLLRLRQ